MNISPEAFFDWFLSATVRGSLLTAAVLLLQLALRGRLPAFWRHALWLPVLFVLAAPALPESRWSLENVLANETARPTVTAPVPLLEQSAAQEVTPQSTRSTPADLVPVEFAPQTLGVKAVTARIWLVGVATMLGISFTIYARSLRRLRRESLPVGPALEAELADAAETAGVRRIPRLLVCPSIGSPGVAGFLRPFLLLPADFADACNREERRLILLHEMIHLRRGDLPVNGLLLLLQALHWCNPVVWFAFTRFRFDRELACDSTVLAATREDSRQAYGHALLKLSDTMPLSLRSVGFVGVFERRGDLRSRVKAIAAHRRSHPVQALAALGLISALVLAGGTSAQHPNPVDETGDAPVAEAKQGLHKIAWYALETEADRVKRSKPPTGKPAERHPETVQTEVQRFENESAAFEFMEEFGSMYAGLGQLHGILLGRKLEHDSVPGMSFKIHATPQGGQHDLTIEAFKADNPGPLFHVEVPGVSPPQTIVLPSFLITDAETKEDRLGFAIVQVGYMGGLKERLGNLVLPELNVEEMPIREVAELLTRTSRELDPEGHGAHFHVMRSDATETERTKISLQLRNAPLSEVIGAVAAQAGLLVSFDDLGLRVKLNRIQSGIGLGPDGRKILISRTLVIDEKGETKTRVTLSDENGQVQQVGFENDQGQKDGELVQYWPTGKVKSKQTFKNGIPQGAKIEYDEKGNAIAELSAEDKEVLVLGEVATPGYVSLRKLTDTRTETVLDAAGKVTANADLKNAHILVPSKDGNYKIVDLDLSADGRIAKQASHVKAGNIIFIPPRKDKPASFTVFVLGEVDRPGAIARPQDEPLLLRGALEMAGGVTAEANTTELKIRRAKRDDNGNRVAVTIDLASEDNPQLAAGDVVIVPTLGTETPKHD